MDDSIKRESHTHSATLLASPMAVTAQEILEKLTRWQAVVEARLQAQMSLSEVLEEYLLIELRSHYRDGNIDPNFIGTLFDTVLQRVIDQRPLVYDQEQDAAYRWPGGADLTLPAERREIIVLAVEGAAESFVNHYKDYLNRHWKVTVVDAALEQMIKQKLDEHRVALDAIFQAEQLVGLSVEGLRGKIENLQNSWLETAQLSTLATRQERVDLDALARLQLPDWLRVLGESDRKRLQAFQERTSQAQALLDELLDGLGSLRAYARQLAKDYIRLELDMEAEPDSIQVQLKWRTVAGEPVQTHSLSDLLALGPLRRDALSVLSVKNGTTLRNQPLSRAFITQLLENVDAPAGYSQALDGRYGRADLKDAMLDWLMARLRQSAFIARCAGHLTVTGHDNVRVFWDSDTSALSAPELKVCGLTLPNALKCADLLLFYREGPRGQVSDLLLYAPGKPDGQEWIELASLRAVSAQMGAWTNSEAGREYLLQQLSPNDRGVARKYFSMVVDKPTSWDLSEDLRGAVTGFRTCLEDAVATGLANNKAQVELNDSPPWYCALELASRRTISSLSRELLVHQQVFNEHLADYEVFVDFAKRTVTQALASYMRGKGVQESVDPATVLIDYSPGLSDGETKEATLLDLAVYGYDDNWGIDNRAKGVRSSVGQDLRQVRSADLALYVRGAYLGDKYAKDIRAKYLNANVPAYATYRTAYSNMLLARIDRDLRVARGRSQINADEFARLTQQVTLLSGQGPAANVTDSTVAVQREGLIKFTVGGHVVLGVYVFVYFDSKGAQYWLYMPDAPDDVIFRKYQSFSAEVVAQLHDYVLTRVALTARTAASRTLTALTALTTRVDTLREIDRITDIKSEFDACIERAVTDVEDITTSRAEVIRKQIIKGLLFASAPLCMVYPPFALLLDSAFVVLNAQQAVEAHMKGDTAGALEHWLQASWGALFATLGAGSVATLLGRMVRDLKFTTRPLSLFARRLRTVTSVAAKETGPVIQPLRLKPKQAVKTPPDNLTPVTDEGIFQGTYRSLPNASQLRSTHYIRSNGKYYQVKEDAYFGGLCLVDASRPGALYNQPIRRMANGKWAHNKVGLRGGDGEVRYLGRVDDLRTAFAGHIDPDVTRGALQGEAVVARFSAAGTGNYLFSLNAQTCVIASLYNPTTKVGAVIHFDHNIRSLIERSVRDVMQRLGGSAKDIRVTLVGGDWLTGADIGGSVRLVMRHQGLRPTWDHWSYSSCLGNTYGVSLDLRSGVTSIFKTSQEQVENFYRPMMAGAMRGTDSVSRRAYGFMSRFRREPLVANAQGVVRNQQHRPATASQIELHAFSTVMLN